MGTKGSKYEILSGVDKSISGMLGPTVEVIAVRIFFDCLLYVC